MTPRHLKLYHFNASRSARAKWMLHEVVGEAFETVDVALYDGEQYEPGFLALNPNHNVPVLEITWDNWRVQRVLESGAIVAFLADAYPEKGLAPAPGPSPERADYLQMLHFGSTWMDMMLWQVRIHEHVLPRDEHDPRTIERYRRKFASEAEPQIAARLELHPFICGETFTAADCVMGHTVMWARGYGLCQMPVFKRYLSTLSKRPAFAAAFADAHRFSPEVPKARGLVGRFTG
jgi:glutathione S-transferase